MGSGVGLFPFKTSLIISSDPAVTSLVWDENTLPGAIVSANSNLALDVDSEQFVVQISSKSRVMNLVNFIVLDVADGDDPVNRVAYLTKYGSESKRNSYLRNFLNALSVKTA